MNALSIDIYDEAARAKIEALQWKLAQELLALGTSVVIEWGTWGRSERDTLRIRAHALGAAVELHYLSAPPDVLFERIQRRGMENPPITREALLQWIDIFQVPTPEEMALFDNSIIVESRRYSRCHPERSEGPVVNRYPVQTSCYAVSGMKMLMRLALIVMLGTASVAGWCENVAVVPAPIASVQELQITVLQDGKPAVSANLTLSS